MNLPKPPEEQELKNIIDKLANFVARNGPEFEHLTKQKQKDNQKFSFLFGGEHFNYYQYKVTTEQAILRQQKQKLGQSVGGINLPGPPPWQGPSAAQPPGSSAGPGGSSMHPGGPGGPPNMPPTSIMPPNMGMPNMPPNSSSAGPPSTGSMPPSSVTMPPNTGSMPPMTGVLPPSQGGMAPNSSAVPVNSGPTNSSGMSMNSGTLPVTSGAPGSNNPQVMAQLQDQLRQIQEHAQEQIKNSEQNLAAQYQSLMAQQQIRVDETMVKMKDDKILTFSKDCGIPVEDMEGITQPIIESCTKDAISNGKNWIFTHHSAPNFNEMFTEYLKKRITSKDAPFELRLHLIYLINDVLHHCQRKHAEDIRKCIENVVVPIFCTTHAGADDDKKAKLSKLLNLWDHNRYFDVAIMEQMKVAGKTLAAYKAAEMTEQANVVAQIAADVQQRYTSLQKQHQDFVAHVNNQMQQRQASVHQQIAALRSAPQVQPPPPSTYSSNSAAGAMMPGQMGSQPGIQSGPSQGGAGGPPPGVPGFPPPGFPSGPPPDFSLPPPGFPPSGNQGPFPLPPRVPPGVPGGNFPLPDFTKPPPGFPPPGFLPPPPNEADLMPSVPYYELPAGLMAPLVKLEDGLYKPLDPKDIRLPPPMPPSERLLAAVEAFYSAPSHERPRDAEGWEKLGLYEFFKAKTRARKMKESEGSKGDHSRSRSRSRSNSRSPPPFRKRRYSERRQKSKSRSPSPQPTRRRSRSRSRSRSQSPVRRQRSPSRSPTPPGFAMNEPFHTNTQVKLGADNKGHQLLKKMGWGGGGLGSAEQGMTDPVSHAEVRDRTDMYKGIGISLNDPFEQFRKSKSAGFIQRMKAREDSMK